jgi:hypothetical protein
MRLGVVTWDSGSAAIPRLSTGFRADSSSHGSDFHCEAGVLPDRRCLRTCLRADKVILAYQQAWRAHADALSAEAQALDLC